MAEAQHSNHARLALEILNASFDFQTGTLSGGASGDIAAGRYPQNSSSAAAALAADLPWRLAGEVRGRVVQLPICCLMHLSSSCSSFSKLSVAPRNQDGIFVVIRVCFGARVRHSGADAGPADHGHGRRVRLLPGGAALRPSDRLHQRTFCAQTRKKK